MNPVDAPDLSIIIVGYRSREPLEDCLTSIGETAGPGVETILVDNASDDGTAAFVRERFPEVVVHENTTNLGYSRAVNQGVRASRGRYALVLNPDIRVLPGALDTLLAFMDEHPDAGMAAAKLLNDDGTLQASCRRFYTFWTLILRRTFLGRIFRNSRALGRYLMTDFDHAHTREVDWVIGACMMVRKEALSDFGLMDERFFLYFEDVDWCFRTWQGGWKVYYVPDAVMQHRYARESARKAPSKLLLAHVISLFHFYEKWGKVAYWMKKQRSTIRRVTLLVSDVVAVNGAFALSYLLRSSMRGLLSKPMFGAGIYQNFLIFANIVFLFSFALFGLYDRRTEREDGADVFVRAVRATVVSAVILMASTFLTSQTQYSRVLVGVFCVLAALLVTFLRMGLRGVHRAVQAGSFDLRRVVIVGVGPAAERMAGRIVGKARSGYDLAGLVDAGVKPSGDFGLPVIGTLEELPGLLEEHRIGEVIFAEPSLSNDSIADFLLRTRRSPVDVKMLSGFSDILTLRARVEEFLDLPVVSFEREAMLRAGAGAKRLADVLGALVLVVLWAPLAALTALVTGVSGRGGPVATIEMVGRDDRRFGMRILRPVDEPNALRRFLASHGLAAVPQVLNVLRGEMSFVGPRPLSPEETSALSSRAAIRFDARPGITGPARIALADARDGLEEKRRPAGQARDDFTNLETYYVQNWSLSVDVKILLRWMGRCLSGRCRGE